MEDKRDNVVIVYTDGSCTGNVKDQGIGGYSAILYKNNTPLFITGYAEKTTNQRMEMMAVISALEILSIPMNITICTDSAYVYNCINQKWYDNWNKNNWKNAKGEPVANKDLWGRILTGIKFHKSVYFIKVEAHKDNIFNNKCDENAKDIVTFHQQVIKYLKEPHKL